jgi:hypothetical protein
MARAEQLRTETRHRAGGGERIDTTCKYAVPGPVAGPVMAELRRGHALQNRLVELERAYQAAKTAAWEEDPQVAVPARAVTLAGEAHESAREALAAARIRARNARKQGRKSAAGGLRQEVDTARLAAAAAKEALLTAKQHLRGVKDQRWPRARRAIAAARQARDQAVKGTYAEWRDAGGYWATWSDIVANHKTAVARVNRLRAAGQPAQLRYRRWDGTGTIAVQLQRQLGVTADERADVAQLRARGLAPAQIAARTRFSARTIALMKENGRAKAGDPPYTPAALADGRGKKFRLGPEPPPDYAERPRRERRRLARQGRAVIRVGAGEAEALVEVPVTIHRPMPVGAEAKMARLTVTRCGPDLTQHLTVAVSIPAPKPRPAAGPAVAVHTGWRVLPDGSLRVAVIAGTGPVPDGGVAATGTVRPLLPGGPQPAAWEVIIPAAWRDEHAEINKARACRDAAFNAAAEEAAAWLDAHPAAGEALPSGDEVRQWRSPQRLAELATQAVAGKHGEAVRPLGQMLGALTQDELLAWRARGRSLAAAGWAQQDRRAWRNEARARRRLTRRRDDAWAKIAEWLCRDASRIVVDGWDVPPLAKKPENDDDLRVSAARANRVLAAPGTLREKIASAARLRGVAVAGQPGDGEAATGAAGDNGRAQAHWRCGGELSAAERKERILVPCRRCGEVVDQDVNMLWLMLAR